MDRLHLMSVFVAVAEEEGFAAAARRLRMSPPAVSRAVAALEARLGVKLLNRTTRHVRSTDAGRRYLDDARRILAEADAADEAAAGINAEPRGQLAVTAPVLFGRRFVIPGICDYLRRYPDMQISALLVDRVVSLLEEGQDVGLRVGELPDSSLHALRVGQVRLITCAAPDYLARHGKPRNPKALQAHSIITSTAGDNAIDWRFDGPHGSQTLRLQPRLVITSNDAAIEAAIAGLGITRLLSYQLAPHLAADRLQAVFDWPESPSWPIHIVHREGRYASAKIRSFVDLMAERLRAEPSLQ